MMKVFSINIEFDRFTLLRVIEKCAIENKRGYVCFVDANVLSISRSDANYCKILKNAMINSCDGSSVAAIVNLIYHTNVRAYNGPDLFEHYIEQTKYKQLLIGNTEEKYQEIVCELNRRGFTSNHISHVNVPFANVENFDYQGIANEINYLSPDFIWVSLGAPKQERFMALLLPYVNRGVMFGIGAAFNFYIGEIIQPKFRFGALRFIWLDRIYREPKKQLKRVRKILKTMPLLYWDERKRYKASLR